MKSPRSGYIQVSVKVSDDLKGKILVVSFLDVLLPTVLRFQG